jgi:hypothetical protein
MVSARNIAKYLADHPHEFSWIERWRIKRRLRKRMLPRSMIPSGAVEKFLGDKSKKFFDEVTTDLQHIKIGLDDLKRIERLTDF